MLPGASLGQKFGLEQRIPRDRHWSLVMPRAAGVWPAFKVRSHCASKGYPKSITVMTSPDVVAESCGGITSQKSILQVSRLFESGSSLILLPVAANMALQSAGAMSDTPGSPTPAGGALLSTTYTFVW